MSATRQQRRQQLLNELESVRHLLLEPDAEAPHNLAADSIPTLSEIMLPEVISQATNDGEADSASSSTDTAESTAATSAPDAMQQLIAKLTQRPSVSSGISVSSCISANNSNRMSDSDSLPQSDDNQSSTETRLSTMLFTPAIATAAPLLDAAVMSSQTESLLFQAISEAPIFQAPSFTELELRQPQFISASTRDNDSSSAASASDITAAAISADDIDQLLFEIMPAVEELLRERLSALLLKKQTTS